MIKQLKISFAGSFQARLATDDDDTNASPTDPYGTYGAAARGWTFAYKESKFDRIIRFSAPVNLRNALVDPWKDVKVTTVEEDTGKGLVAVAGDALLGKVVSIGNAVFDTKAGGGGVTREALLSFKLSIGGGLITADPVSAPLLNGVDGIDHSTWKKFYESRKVALITGLAMDAVRAKVLTDRFFETYASFFELRCVTKPAKLKGVTFKLPAAAPAVKGPAPKPNQVLVRLDSPASTKYTWTAQIAFYRFDGDTLTGQADGFVQATHV
jgi:hypothetical protein